MGHGAMGSMCQTPSYFGSLAQLCDVAWLLLQLHRCCAQHNTCEGGSVRTKRPLSIDIMSEPPVAHVIRSRMQVLVRCASWAVRAP